MNEESMALWYLFGKLHDDVSVWSSPLSKVLSQINHAPPPIKQFLKDRCRSVQQLEEYLRGFQDKFWIENGRVSVHYTSLREDRDKAVDYFEEILDTYEILPHYTNFNGHLGQADDDIQGFIKLFYPGDFKQFLLDHSDVFVVFDDGTVSLIEEEAVSYFEERLEEGREGWYYMNLQGCIGQAPKHVINFINNYYPEEDFLQFLQNNSDAFVLREEGYVYLSS